VHKRRIWGVSIPRLPVDGVKVIEHRITLGGKERQMLESTLTAYSFRNVATPVVTAINDNTTLLLLAGLVGLAIPTHLLPEGWEAVTEGMTIDEVKDWLEIQNFAGAMAGAAVGSYLGPVGAVIGAILGSMGVEVGEDVVAGIPVATTSALIVLQTTLRQLGEALQP